MRANTDRRPNRPASPRRGRPPTFTPRAEELEARAVPATTSDGIARALDLPAEAVVHCSRPDESNIEVRSASTTGDVLGFPSGRDEDFLVISTGLAASVPALGSTDLFLRGEGDGNTLDISLPVPAIASGQTQYLKLDYRYLTSEHPPYGDPDTDPFFVTVFKSDGTLETRILNSAQRPGPGATETFAYEVPPASDFVAISMTVVDRGGTLILNDYSLRDSAVLIDNVRFETKQLVYLNFDRWSVTFPFRMGGVDAEIPRFEPSDIGSSEDRAALIGRIAGEVAALFPFNIEFTTTPPEAAQSMMVVVGGDNGAAITLDVRTEELLDIAYPGAAMPRTVRDLFDLTQDPRRNGLYGEAASVDIGNRIQADEAVVFSRELGGVPNLDQFRRLVVTIAHEVGHNLGLRHEDNGLAGSVMKKYAPLDPSATFENQLNELALGEEWYDEATHQNAFAYLTGVLGLAGAGSYTAIQIPDPNQNLRLNLSGLRGKVFGLTLGVTGPGSSLGAGGADDSPVFFDVPDGSSLVELTLPVVYQDPRVMFYGSSRPGGPVDVVSGAAVGGRLGPEDMFVRLFSSPGVFNAAIPVSYGLPGQLSRIGTAAVSPAVGDRPVVVEPPLLPPAHPLPAYAVGAGAWSTVRVFNPDGTEKASLLAYDPSFGGGVRVALADVTGDGVPDVIAGPGPGGGPLVRVFDGVGGGEVASFLAFEESFTGGLFVAAADLDGDGKAEVVVSPDQGGGPIVAVYSGAKLTAGAGAGAQLARFFGIQDPDFRGGARPALGDVNGDGTPDLVVSAGFLGGPRVAIFDGRDLPAGAADPRKLVGDFFAYEPGLRNGAFVAAGDVTGDGVADLAFGGGPGGAPRVRLFDGQALLAAGPFSTLDAVPAAQKANFFAGDPALRGGVRLALRDAAGDGTADLVTGSGEGEASRVRVYRTATLLAGTTAADQELDPFGAVLANGVFVG